MTRRFLKVLKKIFFFSRCWTLTPAIIIINYIINSLSINTCFFAKEMLINSLIGVWGVGVRVSGGHRCQGQQHRPGRQARYAPHRASLGFFTPRKYLLFSVFLINLGTEYKKDIFCQSLSDSKSRI